MKRELYPMYDSAKSFYGKAMLEIENGTTTLYSYCTKVAEVDTDLKVAKVFGTYSATTLRHIKEFLKQAGYEAKNKSQIEKTYMVC